MKKRSYFSHDVSGEERLLLRSADGPNGCRLWTGGVKSSGYGQLWVGGANVSAHRLAYERANGPIPDGLHVLHRCDVPACINPAHLFLGTHAENMADKVNKGRHKVGDRRGENNSFAKLSEAEALAISARIDLGEDTGTLADTFGVSRSTINNIKQGAAWSYLTGRGRQKLQPCGC